MTKLHIVRKRLKTGIRTYVYAWRGGPQIHVQDGTRPVITPDLLDKAFQARQTGNANYALSFDSILDLYQASPEYTRLAKVTRDDYLRWLTRISKRFGNVPIAVLSDYRLRKDILAWRDKWADTPRAADRAIGTLSTVLGWAAQRGMVRDNIAKGMGTLHRVNHADEIWEDRHWQSLDAVPAHIMAAIQFARFTGLRLGDLVKVEWSDVGANAIVVTTSKAKVRAAIPIHAELKAFLEAQTNRSGAILRNSKGQAWTASGLKSSWRTARPDGFDRRWHDLRGTCATWLCCKGLTDDEIARIIGWTRTRVAEIRARYVDEARTVISLAERLNA